MFIVSQKELALYFLRAFLLGAVFAGAYLFCGFERLIVRKLFGNKRIIYGVFRFVFDFAFCMLSAFADLLFVYSVNRGQVRITALLCQAAGFLLVILPLSKPVNRMERAAVRQMYRVIVVPQIRCCKKQKMRIKAAVKKKRMRRFDGNVDRLIKKSVSEHTEAMSALLGEERNGKNDEGTKKKRSHISE